ncbi:MAG: hypothetical protein HY225_02635 [Candidatus Vogelbacteria bacterium]|nr:hypothetical protein [Candidatus Vogelbacteria bacterium]
MSINNIKMKEKFEKKDDRPYEPVAIRFMGESEEKIAENIKRLREAVALLFEDSATKPGTGPGFSERFIQLAGDVRAGKKISTGGYQGLVAYVLDDHSVRGEDREIFKKNILG